MAAFEVIALDTATPQLRAPGASDTYTFPRAVEMPLGTANGVLYLNGSKVATSGSALTFDGTNTFGVNSASATTIAIDSSGGNFLRGVSFRASGSEFGFDRTNSSTGEYRHAIGPSSGWGGFHTYYVDGSEQMRLTSTGLGIGTSSPSYKLDVRLAQYGYANFESITAGGYSGIRLADPNQPIIELNAGANTFQLIGGANVSIRNYSAGSLRLFTSNLERAYVPAAGGMVVGIAALATTATDGFLYVPTCAGTPTGTPTTQTGTAPIVVDTTNNKLYFYSGGQWRDAGP